MVLGASQITMVDIMFLQNNQEEWMFMFEHFGSTNCPFASFGCFHKSTTIPFVQILALTHFHLYLTDSALEIKILKSIFSKKTKAFAR